MIINHFCVNVMYGMFVCILHLRVRVRMRVRAAITKIPGISIDVYDMVRDSLRTTNDPDLRMAPLAVQ